MYRLQTICMKLANPATELLPSLLVYSLASRNIVDFGGGGEWIQLFLSHCAKWSYWPKDSFERIRNFWWKVEGFHRMVTNSPCIYFWSKVQLGRFKCQNNGPEKSSRVEDNADFETWPSTYFVSSWNQCKKTYKRRPLLLFFKVCDALAKARNMSVKL